MGHRSANNACGAGALGEGECWSVVRPPKLVQSREEPRRVNQRDPSEAHFRVHDTGKREEKGQVCRANGGLEEAGASVNEPSYSGRSQKEKLLIT